MHWYNCERDQLPLDKERVLIAVKGIYYLAKFEAEDFIFVVSENKGQTAYQAKDQLIYWTEFDEDL
jgi:hypothetical protein